MSRVPHGGAQAVELAEHGLSPDDVLDLSANLHPDGPNPDVIAAARSAPLDRYPDTDAASLRDAIATAHALDPANVLPVPGGTAGIHLIARALLRPGDRATVVTPAFGEYAAAVRIAGASVVEVSTVPPVFALDTGALPPATVTFLCVPDNPTGRDLTRADVLQAVEATGGTVVLDAAYEAFTDGPPFASDLATQTDRVIAVHSMTKLHAVPGLRLGYLVAAAPLIARLRALQHAWPLDAPSIAAGVIAATQHNARRARLGAMRETREWLRAHWEAAGLTVAPGAANFLLVRVGDAARVREALFEHRIVVRDATSFGLPEWVRAAVPPAASRDELAAALVAVAAKSSRKEATRHRGNLGISHQQ
ncbi:MAG: aminotransferase class I/II-fold pyridoxal phosphate-dependent enzyme [Dehalococcoidia bacterium]|nr:MAG: aminotransferase class I/II-fold pyridoxal phosphate-dependent enzyme [Dehalococcoidia bacterium]